MDTKKNTDRRTEVFESLPVRRAVTAQIIPAVASQMITLIYNLADTYFVGMLDDPNQTAAVTVAMPAFVMLTAVSNLFGVGGAGLIARSLGRGETKNAKQIAALSFYGGLVSAFLFSLVFRLGASPLLRLCGATADTYRFALGYAKWVIVLGGPAVILNTLCANLVRAEGSAASASLGVSLGGIVNMILDPIFVLPRFLGYGAAGAGMATAVSNLFAVLYFAGYIILKRRTTVLCIRPRLLEYTRLHLKGILTAGVPSAVQYALTVAAIGAQSKFVSRYETAAVAGLGIVKKLDQLPLYFSIGVSNGLLPLLAYNHAAGNQKRQQSAFRFGCLISFGFSLGCLVCYEAFAPFLTELFIDDMRTRAYGAAFLRIMVTAMPMMSVNYPMIIQFQAMGRVRESLVCSILRKGVLDVPLLFIMDKILPLYGCMMVQPIVDTISLAAAALLCRRFIQSVPLDKR